MSSAEKAKSPNTAETTPLTTNSQYPDTEISGNTDTNRNQGMDLSIFKSDDNHCFIQTKDEVNINNCTAMLRMLIALRYYATLKLDGISSTNNTEGIFLDFCENVYLQLLADYQHVITKHESHLEEINGQLINDDKYDNCDLTQCQLSRRYNKSTFSISRDQVDTKEKNNNTSIVIHQRLIFYQQIFDGIHQWLYHLFDAGMRIKSNVINEHQQGLDNIQNEQEPAEDIDHVFGRITDYVRGKKEKSELISDRFDHGETNNKFKLSIAGKESNSDPSDSRATAIDAILKKLHEAKVEAKMLKDLIKYLKEERFDTDSINDDVIDHEAEGSNIMNFVDDASFSRHIVDIIEDQNSK